MALGKKRTLNSFFQPKEPKKPRLSESEKPASTHETYPFPVPQFPTEICSTLGFCPATEPEVLNKEPDLDLLYFKSYIPKEISTEVFKFLREKLFFYRVVYNINRGSIQTQINTPRFTTVFGVDDTARLQDDGRLVDAKTNKPLPANHFNCKPRPIPGCLNELRKIVEGTTGLTFNFCLVNYYSSGDDR